MASIDAIAKEFFVACETGKGWDVCQRYCTPKATFAALRQPSVSIAPLNPIAATYINNSSVHVGLYATLYASQCIVIGAVYVLPSVCNNYLFIGSETIWRTGRVFASPRKSNYILGNSIWSRVRTHSCIFLLVLLFQEPAVSKLASRPPIEVILRIPNAMK